MAAKSPKKPDPAEETLSKPVLVRMSPTERDVMAGLAKKDSRSLSAWIRLTCLEKARSLGAKV